MEDIPAQQNLEKESISVSLSCQATIYTATPCLPKSQEFIMTRYEERRSTEMPRSSGLNKSWWWVPDIIQVNTIKNEGIIFPKVYHFPRPTQIWTNPPPKKKSLQQHFLCFKSRFHPFMETSNECVHHAVTILWLKTHTGSYTFYHFNSLPGNSKQGPSIKNFNLDKTKKLNLFRKLNLLTNSRAKTAFPPCCFRKVSTSC